MKKKVNRFLAVFASICILVGSFPVIAAAEVDTTTDAIVITPEENEAASQYDPIEGSEWTICIYMCGTDLESGSGAATNDLIEMIEADIPDDVTVLIMTGGTAVWNPYGADDEAVESGMIPADSYVEPDSEHTQIYLMRDDGMTLIHTYGENMNMGDANTMAEFFEFALAYAPSEHLMTSVWNHGGGPLSGVAVDQYTGEMISMIDVGRVAEAAAGARGGDNIDIFGFDTCLTSNIETAYLLSPYVDYMVASEETEPSTGWNYLWMDVFNETNDPVEIGKAIVDAYAKTGSEKLEWSDAKDITLALTDLSQIPELYSAFNVMAEELWQKMQDPEEYADISRAAEKAQAMYNGQIGMLDLYDFASSTLDDLESADDVIAALGTPPGTDEANYVGNTIGDSPVVIYRGTGESYSNCIGLAFFHPTVSTLIGTQSAEAAERYTQIYRDINLSDTYSDYLNELLLRTDKLQTFTGNMNIGYNSETNNFYMQVDNIEDSWALNSVSLQCNYTRTNEDGSETVFELGSDNVMEDWDNAYFEEQFDGQWYSINGQVFTAKAEDYSGDVKFTIPVVVEGDEYLSLMTVYYLQEYDCSFIYCISGIAADGKTDRTYVPQGNFTFSTALMEYGSDHYELNDPITISEPDPDNPETLGGAYILPIQRVDLTSGMNALYTLYFAATDIKGNMYLSDPCESVLVETFSELEIEPIPAQIYTGEAVEPEVYLLYGDGYFYDVLDYDITYENNVEIGTATVTLTSNDPEFPGQLSATFEIMYAQDILSDVYESDWYFDAAHYMIANGLMTGVSDKAFAPNDLITRGMFAQILYRIAGEPEIETTSTFTDVSSAEYYTDAVAWAQSEGIINGMTETEFMPDNYITREEIAAIIYRFASYAGLDVSATADLSIFTDNAEAADWASESLSWSVGYGIISGKENNTLDPQGNATRAEAAAMLQRFLEA